MAEEWGLSLSSYGQNEVLRQMKEDLCYCGELPEKQGEQEYKLPDGQTVTGFPFRAPEFFFFDPMRLDWAETSLEESVQAMVFKCVMDVAIDLRKKLTENIILAGGNTLFSQMMYQKLKTEGEARATILKVEASKERNPAAWNAGSVVAQMPNYADELVTVDDYEEEGADAVYRHNLLADDSGR